MLGRFQSTEARFCARATVDVGIVVLGIVVLGIGVRGMTAPAHADQAGIVGGEIAAFANQLGQNPDMAIDLTGVSGEYCFNAGIGDGGHMTH